MKSLLVMLVILISSGAVTVAQTADAFYSQAYNLSARGDKDGAIDYYTKALHANSSYKKAYAERGILYHNLGQTDKALDDFSKALNIDPSYDYARRNRAAIYMEKGNFEAAVNDYDQLIKQDPQFSFYYDLRGVANYKIGRKEAALSDFNKCLDISPDNEEVQVKRAKLLLELGKDEEAYEALSNTDYSKSKLDTEAKLQLARSSRKVGEYQKSLDYLSSLVGTGFKPEIVYLEKGLDHLLLKQYPEAITAFDNCLKQNPSNEVAYVNKASAESQSGLYSDAVDTYTEILNKWGKDHTRALNGRAIAYYGMGNAEAACADWETAAGLGDQNAKDNHASYCSKEQLEAAKQSTKAKTEESSEVVDEKGEVAIEEEPEILEVEETGKSEQVEIEKSDEEPEMKSEPKEKKTKKKKPKKEKKSKE